MSSRTSITKSSMYDEKEFEWEIPRFFEFEICNKYESATVSFGESKWIFCFCLVCNEWILILYCKEAKYKMKMELKFGFKKLDGNLKLYPVCSSNRIIEAEAGHQYFIKRWDQSELCFREKDRLYGVNARSEFTSLKVVFIMKRSIVLNTQEPTLHGSSPITLIKLDTLSENFRKLLADKDNCDVTLQVKEKEFKAHKTVLVARSPVFASMFHHDTSENQTGIITISDCDPDSFYMFLEYLYSGKLQKISFPITLHLYSISDKYNVQELKTFCVEYLERCLTKDNLCEVVMLADLYNETKLLTAAQKFFNKNADKVIETAHWNALMKSKPCLANLLIKEMYQKLKK